MSDTLYTLILSIAGCIIYTAIFIVVEFAICDYKEPEGNIGLVTPYILSVRTEMNKFGCWFWAILIRILNPVWSVIGFVYWITHIKKSY